MQGSDGGCGKVTHTSAVRSIRFEIGNSSLSSLSSLDTASSLETAWIPKLAPACTGALTAVGALGIVLTAVGALGIVPFAPPSDMRAILYRFVAAGFALAGAAAGALPVSGPPHDVLLALGSAVILDMLGIWLLAPFG